MDATLLSQDSVLLPYHCVSVASWVDSPRWFGFFAYMQALVGLSIRVSICHCNVSPHTKVNLRLQILSIKKITSTIKYFYCIEAQTFLIVTTCRLPQQYMQPAFNAQLAALVQRHSSVFASCWNDGQPNCSRFHLGRPLTFFTRILTRTAKEGKGGCWIGENWAIRVLNNCQTRSTQGVGWVYMGYMAMWYSKQAQ